MRWGNHVDDELATARIAAKDDINSKSSKSKSGMTQKRQSEILMKAQQKVLNRLLDNDTEKPKSVLPQHDPFMTIGPPVGQ